MSLFVLSSPPNPWPFEGSSASLLNEEIDAPREWNRSSFTSVLKRAFIISSSVFERFVSLPNSIEPELLLVTPAMKSICSVALTAPIIVADLSLFTS